MADSIYLISHFFNVLHYFLTTLFLFLCEKEIISIIIDFLELKEV